MKTETLFSHNIDEYETPQDLYESLNDEFGFNLDPCSTDSNCKCTLHFTVEEDGLKQSWSGCRVFCNPPYSQVGKWVRKAYRESKQPDTLIVLLVPARTDTKWFHGYCLHRAEIRFIKGRLRFSGAKYNAPFPSMIVVFRGECMT